MSNIYLAEIKVQNSANWLTIKQCWFYTICDSPVNVESPVVQTQHYENAERITCAPIL